MREPKKETVWVDQDGVPHGSRRAAMIANAESDMISIFKHNPKFTGARLITDSELSQAIFNLIRDHPDEVRAYIDAIAIDEAEDR